MAKVKLTGTASYVSSKTLGRTIRMGQTLECTEADATYLLSVTQDGVNLFTTSTDIPTFGILGKGNPTSDVTSAGFDFSNGQMVVPGGVSLPSGVSAAQAASRFANLNTPPVGVNAFQLIYDILQGKPQYNEGLLDWIASVGVKVVRIMWPVFSTADYAEHVWANGPTTNVTNASLKPSFIAACDKVFNDAAARGLKLWVSIFWTQSALPGVFNETLAQAYGSLNSRTVKCMESFTEWFTRRYAPHPGLGVYSFGNEWRTDDAGVTHPTPAQLGAVFTYLANGIRAIDPTRMITSNLEGPIVQTNQTRENLAIWAARYKLIFEGLDAWTLHLYDSTTNYIGRNKLFNSAFQALDANTSGYEGIAALASCLRASAASANKMFVVGECGTSMTMEASTKVVKKDRMMRGLTAHCDLTMIWNVQTVYTAAANQLDWYLEPGTARANVYAALIRKYNQTRTARSDIAGGTLGLTEQKRPRVCWTPARTTANSFVTATSNTLLAAATRYAVMFWGRSNATSGFAAFEIVADLRLSTQPYGMTILGDSTANTSLYAAFSGATGSAGNTGAGLPYLVAGEWHHYAFIWALINGTPAIEFYVDGIYWGAVLASPSIVPAAIPNGTALKLGGSTVGGPMSLQDFAVYQSADSDEVLRHLNGGISPSVLMHIRALSDGTISDFSKVPCAVSIGTGVTVDIA